MSKRLMILALVIVAVSAWIMYAASSRTEQGCVESALNSFRAEQRRSSVQEDFVASNARQVGKDLATIIQLDTQGMKAAFAGLVEADKNVLNLSKCPVLQPVDADRTETNRLIDTCSRE